MDIFIGVDGGATQSRIRVEDAEGKLIGQTVGGPANIRLSVEQAWHAIYQNLSEALQTSVISLKDNKNYRLHVGLGLAGCEYSEARREFLLHPHPFTTIKLESDAHIACIGAHGTKNGAIIIVGTGVVGHQIEAGKGTRVGGWGFPNDDIGGGAWLGLEAVRQTFQWLDHRIEKTPFLDDVFAFFDRDTNHLIKWVDQANSTEYARLAPLVINHSQQGDALAVKLMKKAGHAINRIGAVLEKLRGHQDRVLPCSLLGGISPFIETWLDEELRARLVPRQADANVGAILMIREMVKQKYAEMETCEV